MRVRLARTRWRAISVLRWALMLFGLGALGYAGYVYLDAELYQKYENWAFDEELHGRTPSVPAFLADSTPLRKVLRPGAVAAEKDDVAPAPGHEEAGARMPAKSDENTTTASGVARQAIRRALIGRIEIPRLRIHAVVREGDDDSTLRRAVGHIPSTALPGIAGNVGLAAHRDTFFRALKNVRKHDRISIQTLDGDYHYVVDSMKVVNPTDVEVLAPTDSNVLTLVTCYPFNYVGHAPKRYIVRARQVDAEGRTADASPASDAGGEKTALDTPD